MEQLTDAFLNDGLTAGEQADLKELLKLYDNRDYFKKMYVLWHNAHHAGDEEYIERALQKVLSQLDKQQQQRQVVSGWYISFRKMVAAILIAFALGAVFYHIIYSRKQISSSSIAVLESSKVIVPLGSQSHVELPDGSVVTLNAGSNLHYRTSYGQASREVWLEGEGYFNVVKNASKPFIVNAKDVIIKALGTEFNVKAYPEENTIQTTLVNGLVTVKQMNTTDNSQEITLKPKQTVTFYEQTTTINAILDEAEAQPAANPQPDQTIKTTIEKVELKNNISTEIYTSWKDPRWVIESEPMSDLAVKLQRRFDVQIIIADDVLKQYPFNGTLTDETLEQVLEIMKSIAPINYSLRKKTVTLTVNAGHKKYFDELMRK
jgi:ferric-dicitrate binding protein FerR (iron transport regulator)